MKEISRRPAEELNKASFVEVRCVVCGKKHTLWENGGELDQARCCGHTYRLEWPGVPDLVIEFR